uniref:Uncharacterized protein n=1 Tax=Anguilla anguilla TaxID=7936 RepID=A0A0E9SBU6_ANGAN
MQRHLCIAQSIFYFIYWWRFVACSAWNPMFRNQMLSDVILTPAK